VYLILRKKLDGVFSIQYSFLYIDMHILKFFNSFNEEKNPKTLLK
jgi:hypothetical protein